MESDYQRWAILSHYQRFESLVAFVLTIIISLIILLAVCRLTISVLSSLISELLDPLDRTGSNYFGEILPLLIAMEFNHTFSMS